ncbi:MAG: radical SAM/SPASM domain-containing protein [Hyphomicrobiales bacterium]
MAIIDSKLSSLVDRKPNVQSTLDFLWLEVTNACNLTCSHCYAGSGPNGGVDDKLSQEQYISVINAAADIGCRKVQFIGGEATLHPGLPKMIEVARSRKFTSIEVFTNLVRLNEQLLDCFVQNGVSVASSFYSFNAATHDSITGRPGSWQRTVVNLKSILAAGLDCRVGIITMDQNRADLQKTEAFLHSLGVLDIGRDEVRAFGRAASDDGSPEMSELCGSCAGDVICVGYDGKVSPCIMSKHWSVGDLAESSFADILSSRKLGVTREQIHAETWHSDQDKARMGSCNPDCTPCSPKTDQNCTPKTYCYPKHSPGCSPKF